MLPNAPAGLERYRLVAKNAMDLFQKIIHGETPRCLPEHTVTEKDLVSRCIGVLIECFEGMKKISTSAVFASVLTGSKPLSKLTIFTSAAGISSVTSPGRWWLVSVLLRRL